MKAIELQPKRSTYNPSPLGKNNNNIRKSSTARLSRSDSKNHVDDAALASVSFDLEVQKLQEEEEKGCATYIFSYNAQSIHVGTTDARNYYEQ